MNRHLHGTGLFVCLLILLASFASPARGQQPADPRDLVVMLDWKKLYGDAHQGAGIIINQSDEETLIVTAKHNLLDLEAGEINTDITVKFRPKPGHKAPAEVVHLSSQYDVGLLRVAAEDAVPVLGATVPAEVLNLEMKRQEDVFVVGHGGGAPWFHTLTPEPARWVSMAEIQIESQAQKQGQSGGGVFDPGWALVGMITELEPPIARALPIALVLDEVRRTRYGVLLAPSAAATQDDARRTLAGRNISWSVAGVADALTAVDVEVLGLFVQGGVEPGMIIEALGSEASGGTSVAQVFFERAKHNAEAIEWLRDALAQGLDPNAAVKGGYYEREGLLHAAVRAGNAQAVTTLVEGGASPHAYQDLWFTPYPITRFLLPFHYVVTHETFSQEEKQAILELFLANGGIIPDTTGLKRYRQVRAVQDLLAKAPSHAGVDLTPRTTQYERTRVCEYASERDDFDWCAWAEALPRQIRVEPGKKGYYDFWHLELLGLMNVVNGKAYFMGMEESAHMPGYDVVEVSADALRWNVYRYMNPGAGMGHCKESADGYQPDECWRRISMTYQPEQDRMMVVDYYPYQVSHEPATEE